MDKIKQSIKTYFILNKKHYLGYTIFLLFWSLSMYIIANLEGVSVDVPMDQLLMLVGPFLFYSVFYIVVSRYHQMELIRGMFQNRIVVLVLNIIAPLIITIFFYTITMWVEYGFKMAIGSMSMISVILLFINFCVSALGYIIIIFLYRYQLKRSILNIIWLLVLFLGLMVIRQVIYQNLLFTNELIEWYNVLVSTPYIITSIFLFWQYVKVYEGVNV